jgi:hypothetical protein
MLVESMDDDMVPLYKSNSIVVQYTIKIKQPESGYTVNIIYTITSRLLINGKGWQKLIDKDIPLIHGIF